MGVKRIPGLQLQRGVRAQVEGESSSERTLEANPVAPKTLHSLLEEDLAFGGHTGDVVLLPLNGSIGVLEDFLDRLGNFVTDTVTRN